MAEYAPRRLEVAKIKADQIKDTGAGIVATACHNCVDGLTDLIKKYDLKYDFQDGKPAKLLPVPNVCELVAEAMVVPKEITKTKKAVKEVLAGKRILVIDDEPDQVDFLQAFLEDNGFEVITAHDGTEGLNKAMKNKPDLITLDVTMPGKSGVQVFSELRNNKVTHDIPVFIITGVVDFRQLMYQKKVQAPDGFMKKPVDKDALLMNINKILEQSFRKKGVTV